MRWILLVVTTSMFLLACSPADSEQSAQVMEHHGAYDLADEHEEATLINQLLVDNDDYKLVLISTRYGPRFGSMAKGEHKVRIYGENKLDHGLFFRVSQLVIDDIENKDYEIAGYFEPHEKQIVTLFAFDYDGDIPMMEERLNFVINAYHGDTHEEFAAHEIDISF